MTKEQKFLLLVVLLVAGAGSVIYVQNQKAQQEALTSKPLQIERSLQNSASQNITNTESIINSPISSAKKVALAAGNMATEETANTVKTQITNTAPKTTQTVSVAKTLETAVTYPVPENHTDTLKITVNLKDGLIADISFSENPSNKDSREYYTSFSNNFSKGQFIGKSIESVSLSRLGGASLTTRAFNAGIADIAKQANNG